MSNPVWSSGWNIPGYLPDDEPMDFPTWDEAVAALREALEQAIDDFASESHTEALLYEEAIEALDHAEPDTNVTLRVGNYAWWVQHIYLREED